MRRRLVAGFLQNLTLYFKDFRVFLRRFLRKFLEVAQRFSVFLKRVELLNAAQLAEVVRLDRRKNPVWPTVAIPARDDLFNASYLNDLATDTLGDNKDAYKLAIMHSSVARTLENLQVLDYWKQTDANGIQRNLGLAYVNGYTVIINDSVPVTAVGGSDANKDLKKYTTYLLGTGVLRHCWARQDVPVEVVREAMKNNGQDTLVTRIRECIHPNGFSFKLPTSGWTNSPTDAQLEASANWAIKFAPKEIPIARLITNG